MIYALSDLYELSAQKDINGKWVAARPIEWQGWYKWVLRGNAAWAVLTGKADAFTWPEEQ